jgi:AcrR family transcriptional regulator
MPDASPQHRPRPRKAPKQARSLETVKVIVEAAARILERDGFEGFSTNAVAERAGVSIGSLYQYFPSKEALIGALIVRETSQLIDDAEAAMTEPSGAAALSALIQACIAHQFHRPTLARLLDFEEARLPFDADTRKVSERFRAILSTVLLRPDFPRQSDVDAAT